MKELSIEEKAKRYDEAIEKGKQILNTPYTAHWDIMKEVVEYILPALKESEDERIRKELIEFFTFEHWDGEAPFSAESARERIAWLEKQRDKKLVTCPICGWEIKKQGEQTSNKVEPKFKVGDWITNGIDFTFQIHSIEDNMYLRSDDYFIDIETADKNFRLWTIQDAKDGDVLAFDNETMVIFKDLYNATTFHSYCHIEDGIFTASEEDVPDWWEGKGFHPATKEQRDLLFQKMKEAGYEWDTNKKELRKIESSAFKDKLLELFQKFRYIKEGTPTNGDIIDYVDAHVQELIGVQNNSWNEEDEKMLNDILMCGEHHCYFDAGNIAWLKSIKDRVQ